MTKRERQELAKQLSAVLKNPNTPEALFNAMTDQVMFYSHFLDYDSPEVIEMTLEAYELKGNGQESDITRADGIAVIG